MSEQQKYLTPDCLGGSYLYADSANSDAVFGFMVSLTAVIDPVALEKAVNELIPRFPQFSVRVSPDGSGSLTFIPDDSPVHVTSATGLAPQPSPDGRLFTVACLHKSLYFNFHRALTDERGAMTFIRGVLFRYLKSSGFEVENDGTVPLATDAANPFEAIDAFEKMDDIPASRPIWYMDAKAFAPDRDSSSSTCYRNSPYGSTTVVRIPINKMKVRPKGYAEMTTAFVAPFFSDAVQTEFSAQMADDEYIVAAIKVNLRHYFPTPSLRSFYTEVPLAYNRNIGEYPVDTVVMSQKKLLEAQLKTDALAYNAQRKLALLEKVYDAKTLEDKIAVENNLMEQKSARAAYSLTNVGNVILPETLSRFVTEFYPVLPTTVHPFAVGAVMLHGDLSLAITAYRDADELCRRFVALLNEHDFHAYISDKFTFPFMAYSPLQMVMP